MITKLDDGVGAVRAALEKAGMFSNSVIAFCSDNGGPLDHATNLPLRGGKHTLWDGGLRVTAWVSSPLFHPDRRGTVWDGLMCACGPSPALSSESVVGTCRRSWQTPLCNFLRTDSLCAAGACRGLRRHASDWLPTWVVGVAGQSPSVATGPRPLDGHNLWDAWTSPNATSPRTEIIHQVVNKYLLRGMSMYTSSEAFNSIELPLHLDLCMTSSIFGAGTLTLTVTTARSICRRSAPSRPLRIRSASGASS